MHIRLSHAYLELAQIPLQAIEMYNIISNLFSSTWNTTRIALSRPSSLPSGTLQHTIPFAKMSPAADDHDHFTAKDAMRQGTLYGALGLGGGFFFAATQNALSRQNRGALGVFTHSGGPILICCT